jgi:DNA-binding winged helix-turn-helix (wHTH) protein
MAPPAAAGEFELAGWHVYPSLNRLSRGETSLRLEPKMMDVLVALARRPGEVLSKDELAAAVWPGLFITESVITRAIAGLRRALEDDARAPRFIETIAKRGYRLLAAPRSLAPARVEAPVPGVAVAPAAVDGAAVAAGRSTPLPSPFSPGQWVRGDRFHGRETVLAEALDGARNGLWLLGARSVGKTSTLKQLAHIAGAESPRRYLPLFWDLQGCEEPADLDAGFRGALAEAEAEIAAAGVSLAAPVEEDCLTALGRLRRAARGRGLVLLLLLDEAEELLALHSRVPAFLRKLRQALQGQEGIRTVLAASSRLWDLGGGAQGGDTSPFLHGFAPPVYLGCLAPEAARAVAARDAAGDQAGVGELLRLAGGHPYLLQLLLARGRELGDAARAAAAVAADPAVHRLFTVDYGLLAPAEREVLLAAARRPGLAPAAVDLPAGGRAAAVLHLERLGMLSIEGGLAVAIPLLADWLRENAPALGEDRSLGERPPSD